MEYLQIPQLPINIPEILKFGIIGLGAILAILAFWLLLAEQKKQNPRKLIIKSIYAFMFFSIGLSLIGLLSPAVSTIIEKISTSVVPPQTRMMVDSLPKETTTGQYMLYKDLNVWDLRGWKPVPKEKMNERYSPAGFIEYMHIKKVKDLDKIVIHFATQGYDIDVRCITHNYKLYEEKNRDHGNEGKTIGVEIDVAEIPLNQEFSVVIEATYWNGFNNSNINDVMNYTDDNIDGLTEFSIIALMPYDKPIRESHRYSGSSEGDEFTPYRGAEKFYVDGNGRFIYWDIKERIKNKHYKLEWVW